MSRTPLARAFLLGIGLSLFSATLSAQPDQLEPRTSDTVEEHVVVSGETLSTITENYLGTSHLWRENWRLNPQVRDPDLLRIGQRLRIITHRELPKRTAEVWQMRRIVEKRPPEDWEMSHEGDLLEKDQALRTRERSSAAIRFDDDTLLNLKEETLVVFKEIGRSLRGVRNETISIEQGTADLRATPSRKGSSAIKIIVGEATTEMRTESTGRNLSRLTRSEQNSSSSVMIYEGGSKVSAGGREVDVPAGMGTSVEDGKEPTPPERLLAGPQTNTPAPRATLAYNNPTLTWQPLAGASSYAVEVCDSADCTSLLDRARGLDQTEFTAEGLPQGTFFWRVRGTSASGLDGYPSRIRSASITQATPDLQPPSIQFEIGSLGRFQSEDRALLADGGDLRVTASDDTSGVVSAQYRWNRGRWRPLSREALMAPSAADHVLEIRAVDGAGRSSERKLRVDLLEPPAPPTLTVRGRTVTPARTQPPNN